MKNNSINPVVMLHDYFNELYEKYTTTTDPQQKSVLNKKLINLNSVLQFLASTQNYSTDMGDYA